MSVKKILKARGNKYGTFTDNSTTSQALKDIVRAHENWDNLPVEHKEALDMIFHKVARVMNGDPMYKDNFVDICGYSQLVADLLED